jgi:hypothetical protein
VSYLDHLTAQDLDLLLPADHPARSVSDRSARRGLVDAHGIEELLQLERVYEAVFSPSPDGDPFSAVSPFLVFAVAVNKAARELASASYVSEWLAPGRSAPVFDTAELRDFISSPSRRLFLSELLASYTHVASGSIMVLTNRGIRRQRFSELDPVRMAALLEVVSDAERPGILRRLGDLALFLTGVFPDYVARRGFGPVEEGRLLRSGGAGASAEHDPHRQPASLGDRGAVGLLERLGRQWYRSAFELLPRPVAQSVSIVGELPERFGQARRILGLVTERFLFSTRDRLFGLGG